MQTLKVYPNTIHQYLHTQNSKKHATIGHGIENHKKKASWTRRLTQEKSPPREDLEAMEKKKFWPKVWSGGERKCVKNM